MNTSQPVRILYIEDDQIVAMLMQNRLGEEGYIVDLADSGEAGLAKLNETEYDIVAVDYHLLPNMNGLQVLEKLTEIGFKIPTIMVTGEGNEEIAVQAMKLGASDYLVKDTEGNFFKRLSSVIRNVIERHKLIEDKEQAEVALRHERDFSNAILNTAGCLIVVLDREGHIIRFNHTCEQLTGYTFAEVKTHYVWDFFMVPADIEPVKLYFNQLLTAHPPLQYENIWLTKNQTQRVIVWSNTTLLDDQGQVEYVIGTGIDITERKHTEQHLKRVLAEQHAILNNSMVGIAFLGPGRRFQRVNKKLQEIFGYSEEELIGYTTRIVYPSIADYETIGKQIYATAETGQTYQGEHLMQRQDGSQFYCRSLLKAIDPDNFTKGYIWNVEDITEQRQAEERLRLAATVFETTTEAILITDAQSKIIVVNPAFTTITGYSSEEVIGKQPSILNSGRQSAEFYQAMWKSLQEKGRWQGEIWNRRKSGEIYAQWLSMVAVNDAHQKIIQYVAVFNDITKRKQAEELIWRQANYDELTGLPNRTLFTNRLAQVLSAAARAQQRVALMFIDLDRFKWVNDTLGHKAGDQLLQEAAQRLNHCVRESDTVARLGGDEFTVILPHLDTLLNARKIAERILENLVRPFSLDNSEVSIAGSIGITIFPEDGLDVDTLLKNADTAMYRAKESGRNTFRFFTAAMNLQMTEHLRLENALRRALEHQELTCYYQPVIDLQDGHLVGAEALLRWQLPDGQLILPAQFLPLAEETGLILPIGKQGLLLALQQLQHWHGSGLDFLQLTLNLSTRQLKSPSFLESIVDTLTAIKIAPSQLILEITEGILLENVPEVVSMLLSLKERGIKIALDNFGTGCSSLYYLKQFPINMVKIDASFVQDVTKDTYSATLTEAIIMLAHKLNLTVVGEGVETEAQLEFLQKHGCDLAQGYYFSSPLTAKEFEAFVRNY